MSDLTIAAERKARSRSRIAWMTAHTLSPNNAANMVFINSIPFYMMDFERETGVSLCGSYHNRR